MSRTKPKGATHRKVRKDAPRPDHDAGLKRLFSHPRMAADLLRLLPEDLTQGLDLASLRRLPAEHVGKALRKRFGDLPWCLDFLSPDDAAVPQAADGTSAGDGAVAGGTLAGASNRNGRECCLVPIEFQSTVDPRMAERMLEYAGMLRNDLARGGRFSGPGGGPPPLLPLVVYNGARRWTAPLELGAETLSLPKGLADMQPRFRYALIDVRRFDPNTLAEGLRQAPPGVNFALALFALENASAPDLPDAMVALAGLLGAEGELELAESFGLWVEGVLQARLGVQLPSLTDMMEEPSMLGETLDAWAEEKFQLGRVEGQVEGRVEGRAEGRVEGRVEGERELLFRLTQRRFGSGTADALSRLINGLEDPDRLAKVGDLVVDCATGRELLDRTGRIPSS